MVTISLPKSVSTTKLLVAVLIIGAFLLGMIVNKNLPGDNKPTENVLSAGEQVLPQNPTAPKKLDCSSLPKADKPNLTAYLVSNCPYGLQMQRLFLKTINELPDIANLVSVRYIGSVVNGKIVSMHGDKEAQENLRQICLRDEQKEKYWTYVACYMKEGKTDECLSSAGVDVNSLNACLADQNRGIKYAQGDFSLSSRFNVSGSPTLVLNNQQAVSEFDFGGRTPNAIKDILGCSFTTKPDAFKKDLTKENVAASFSLTDAPQNTSGASANCQTQ